MAAVTLPSPSYGFPVELTGEIATGYNSNPARTHHASGSGFAQYSFAADKRFTLTGPLLLQVRADGNYQEYFRTGNNYFLQSSAELSALMAEGRLTPALIAAVNAYRDDLIHEDERDAVITGTRLSWIASSRLNLQFSFLYQWLDYKNSSLPYGGTSQGAMAPMSMSGPVAPAGGATGGGVMGSGVSGRTNAGAMMGGPAGSIIRAIMRAGMNSGAMMDSASAYEPPRDDRLAAAGIDTELFLTPSLTGKIHVGYSGLHSSASIESYRQQQMGAGLTWEPAATWLVDVEGLWYRTRFYNSSAALRRRDAVYAATIRISKAFGQLEPFVQLGWAKDHSTLTLESYSQTVTQCGIAYSF